MHNERDEIHDKRKCPDCGWEGCSCQMETVSGYPVLCPECLSEGCEYMGKYPMNEDKNPNQDV